MALLFWDLKMWTDEKFLNNNVVQLFSLLPTSGTTATSNRIQKPETVPRNLHLATPQAHLF